MMRQYPGNLEVGAWRHTLPQTSSSHPMSALEDLPLREVLRRLPARDVCSLALTSSTLRARCRRDGAWRDRVTRTLGRWSDGEIPGDEDHCFALYSRLLHAYGPLLGLWRADAPPHGGVVRVVYEAGKEGAGAGRIVGYLVGVRCSHENLVHCSECARPLFYVEPAEVGCRFVCLLAGHDAAEEGGHNQGSRSGSAALDDAPHANRTHPPHAAEAGPLRGIPPSGRAHEGAIDLRLQTCAFTGDNVCGDASVSCSERCYRVDPRNSMGWGVAHNLYVREMERVHASTLGGSGRWGEEVHLGGFDMLRLVDDRSGKAMPAHPLCGLYRAHYGPHGYELILVELERQGTAWELVGLKVSGDVNVPCSQPTWRSHPFRTLPYPGEEADDDEEDDTAANRWARYHVRRPVVNAADGEESPDYRGPMDELSSLEFAGTLPGRGHVAGFGHIHPEWLDGVNCIHFKGTTDTFALHWTAWDLVTLFTKVHT